MRYRVIGRELGGDVWQCRDGERQAHGGLEAVLNQVATWGARVVGVAETFIVIGLPSPPPDLS